MDMYELADLMALSSAERATLNCVKVRGQTRATLVGLTTQRGTRKSCCSTCTTSFDDGLLQKNGHTPAARAAITLSLVLLGEGSAAE